MGGFDRLVLLFPVFVSDGNPGILWMFLFMNDWRLDQSLGSIHLMMLFFSLLFTTFLAGKVAEGCGLGKYGLGIAME
ncbi:hypothetical protein D5R40_25360 [Okeania hirsuta]|uniref:Uncharacterized protein n=1 Tax=Okeania hirsuta TaxID=1458930 RepID=A0A3N6PDP0_9CYAN|nr:hypothetical protein D5R40_25360 [Okeania hirsuta]